MHRVVTLGTAWLVAAVLATVVAWQGIGVVGEQVTDERPGPLSAAEVQAALDRPAPASAPDATATGDVVQPTTTVVTPKPLSSSTTVQPRSAPTTTAAPTTSTTSAPAAETRTYNLVGGSTALRFSPSGVTVLWANPNPGFTVETGSGDGTGGVEVEFRSDTHRSEVDGWWDNGPQDRVREETESESDN